MINLIEQLLEDQQDLTAVERFSRVHAAGDIPAQQQYYSRLLPTATPGEGQQFAFDVDLDKCSGCKACVTACHNLNGLDEEEAWRDVGLLIGGTAELPVMQHVTTACHHCLDPACATACPVDAYEKNPITGIVKHLDDQCFGCQYCTLACPYDVPKYNAAKGIVRKCDMCSERLGAGEAPACVQACPHEAISINIIDQQDLRNVTDDSQLISTAPCSDFTNPTTTFTSQTNCSQELVSADQYHLRPQHAHWPLAIMLVLTQLSAGMFAVGLLLDLTGLLRIGSAFSLSSVHAAVALGLGLLALGSSTCHLGRPQYAFRAVIGLRHSWLSREIVIFGGYSGAAVTATALTWLRIAPPWMVTVMTAATVVVGLAGVFCSIMIYVFTRREYWSMQQTGTKFLLTCPVLGVATSWLTIISFATATDAATVWALLPEAGPWFAATLMISMIAKLSFEASLLKHLHDPNFNQMKRSATMLTTQLKNVTAYRFVAGFVGGVVLPVVLVLAEQGLAMLTVSSLMFVMCFAAELMERYLFFTAVSPDRMPGGLRS